MIFRRISNLIIRHRTPPNVIIWWGSFAQGGGATIGDLHAVQNVSYQLNKCNFDHAVLSQLPLRGVKRVVSDWRHQLPAKLRTIIFVCGPIVAYPPLLEILEFHRSARKIAVGVSVLANQSTANTYFDEILPRDGIPGATFDLALARYENHQLGNARKPGEYDAVCFRGLQTEYGPTRPALYQSVERMLLEKLNSIGGPIRHVTTVIDPSANSADNIMRSIAQARLLATTRMHAAIYALANHRPVVAVDQIPGGAKVSSILEAIEWPLVFKADIIDKAMLDAAFERAKSIDITATVERCRREAIDRSKDALNKSIKLITSGT